MKEKRGSEDMQERSNAHNNESQFFGQNLNRFMGETERYVHRGISPGGYYKAVWCRDASYILRDMFLSGNVYYALKRINIIWSHQIAPGKEKVVYGRGSPQMKLLPSIAGPEIETTFEGALPTTIYKSGFSEVYGKNPDIDSTALVISTTSWILLRFLNSYDSSKDILPPNDLASANEFKVEVAKIVDFVVPCMLKAVEYLTRRDYDKDGLLEQSYNEDWMDTALRTGKIVYSQACWVLALEHLGALLDGMGKNELHCIIRLHQNTFESIEKELWSENAACYVDLLAESDTTLNRVLTQDTLLYLVALTENGHADSKYNQDSSAEQSTNFSVCSDKLDKVRLTHRGHCALDTERSRLWKDTMPLISELELKRSGPWYLSTYQYHNYTLWPWITGIEIMARNRFSRLKECKLLLSKLLEKRSHMQSAFYEWIDPNTGLGNGAYPFKTGISALRMAVSEIIQNENT